MAIEINGNYCRIVSALMARSRDHAGKKRITLDVSTYPAKPATEDAREIAFARYQVPLDDIEAFGGFPDFVAMCYAWLAAQPDFHGGSAV